MDPTTFESVPGGWVGALAGVLAAIGGGYTIWSNRRRADAAERADVMSDNARSDTYEMLRDENKALLERARAAEQRARETELELLRKGDALQTMQRLLKIGATNEQLGHYFAASGLAPLEDDKP